VILALRAAADDRRETELDRVRCRHICIADRRINHPPPSVMRFDYRHANQTPVYKAIEFGVNLNQIVSFSEL